MKKKDELQFMCDTPALLKEIADCAINKDGGVLKIPINILKQYLMMVAQRAIELDDPELNILMLRMKLYEVPHYEIADAIEIQEGRKNVILGM